MMQMIQMMMEDREAARAERQANIAALQQIAQTNQGHGNHDHPGSKLKNFQNTNPPMFSKTEEPLDADDWLQTMENNLEVAGVEAAEKVLFATHYLSGPARAWWTSARAMNAGQMMTWEDFKLKFSKYHVPQGLIKKMRDEFRELKQGRMSVVEYRDRFLTLSRTGSNTVPINPKDKSTINCYECGVVGHYSNECPKKLARIAANTAAPAQQQRRFAGRRNQNNNNGRLYHMKAAEAQEAPQAMPRVAHTPLVTLVPSLARDAHETGHTTRARHDHAGHVAPERAPARFGRASTRTCPVASHLPSLSPGASRFATTPSPSQTPPFGHGTAGDDAIIHDFPPRYCPPPSRSCSPTTSASARSRDRLDVVNNPRPCLAPSSPQNDELVADPPVTFAAPRAPINRGRPDPSQAHQHTLLTSLILLHLFSTSITP
ncbi:hypothetical protein QYE76_041183 [Lolium multiflorum]|uniref:CCHC-type domain-containing protein n=1 Tax=Lolium multiflorum TaxID=4521 RepID=A0AAD8TD39_LOLMU|nr:hypothetical protein QYE76_041183 [Lolium multiflorum]